MAKQHILPASGEASSASAIWAWRLTLGGILVVAASLRLYHLGAPSQWWDEILVPLTAAFPVAYILDFSRHCEMHPPLYHLCIKLVEGVGVSDVALRLPSVVFGLATVYAAWRLFGRLYDRSVGLLAAGFLAGSAMQVWHVRQVRPYAILVFLFTLSLFYFLRFLRERRNADLVAVLALNVPLFLLHYFTFQIVLAEGLVLALYWRPHGQGVSLRQLVVFGLGTAAVALPVLFLFFLPSQTTLSIFGFKAGWGEIGQLIVAYSAHVLWSHDDWAMRLGVGTLLVAGGTVMWKKTPRELCACLLLAAIPAFVLFCMRKTAYFSPRHFLYMTVLAAVLIGHVGRLLPRPGWAMPLALALALGQGGDLYFGHRAAYYDETSYHHPVFNTDFKPMAKELAQRLRPGDRIVGADQGTINAVSWYLDQYVATNPFRSQSLDAASGDYQVTFFAPDKNWGHLGQTEEAFREAVGPIESVEPVLNGALYHVPIRREAPPSIHSVPYHVRRRAAFPAFYQQVETVTDMTVNPYWGGEAIATRNNQPARLSYRLDNAAGPGPQQLQFVFEYKNQGQGSTMAFAARFDDEPPVPLLTSRGPDPAEAKTVSLVREAPYKTLTLTLETICADLTARYPGGNLETAAFRGFDLEIVPAGRFDASPVVANQQEINLGKIEHNEANIWRWGLGPSSTLTFTLAQAMPLWLEFDFDNTLPGQNVVVAANGEIISSLNDLDAGSQHSLRLPVAGRAGPNDVIIAYTHWNHGTVTFAPTDIRPMSLFIRKLRLVPKQ
ncbi:glycosyltransferase family 39 protein [Desulfovibrio sp. TomC]|uniref:glycosyltransferase family 39 protein n=1 Tax=Desulfovibrio sp. TomC TaxID=1562888 RepID=UPI0005751902|nr:glycosyltransferase family 39 protein [Desulfovibrio sp. TomC]KHK04337.1 putative inner membrane protein [Desulfovibrio sp. TomC]